MNEFFYEIKGIDGEQSIVYYRREPQVLRCYGMSRYVGDPNDFKSIKKCIDEFFRGDDFDKEHPGTWPISEKYVAHRLTIDKKFGVKSK